MKTFLLILVLLCSNAIHAQETDLIVTTKLDSIWCAYLGTKDGLVNYSLQETPLQIASDSVYYVMTPKMSRPKYFNTTFDIDAAIDKKVGIVGPVKKENPIYTGVFEKVREVELTEPWRTKAGRRFRTAGVFLIVGAAGIAASSYINSTYPDETIGLAGLGISTAFLITSSGFIISGGTYMMGYKD